MTSLNLNLILIAAITVPEKGGSRGEPVPLGQKDSSEDLQKSVEWMDYKVSVVINVK